MTRNLATYFVAALTAFAATTSANAAAADLIILESNVSSLAAGSVVSESQAVTLAGSARLVMIAPDGTTRSVPGQVANFLDGLLRRNATRGMMASTGITNIWVEKFSWQILPREEARAQAGLAN